MHQRGIPGELTVRVENVRDTIIGVSVRVLGADPDWAPVSEPGFSLFPGEARSIGLRVLLPDAFPAGSHIVTVQVQEHGGSEESVLLPVRVQVNAQELLLLTVRPPMVPGGGHADFWVRAENTGNTAVSHPLVGQDEEDSLDFEFSPRRLDLAPGQRTRVALTVSRRRPLTGMPAPRMFTVHADSRTHLETSAGVPLDGAAAQGVFLQKPRIHRVVLSLAGTVLTVLVVVCIAVFTMGVVLEKNDLDKNNVEQRVRAVGDPAARAALAAEEACPCQFYGRILAPNGTIGNGTMVEVYTADNAESPLLDVHVGVRGVWTTSVTERGEYRFRLVGPGLVPIWFSQAKDADRATPVAAVPGPGVRLASFVPELTLGSMRVMVDGDDPSGARVEVRLSDGTAAPGALVATGVPQEEEGVYLLADLPSPASYTVSVAKAGYVSTPVPVRLAGGEDRDLEVVKLTLEQAPS
ncbi:hypothetical protein JCM9957A_01590 [Kineosporia succinea]